MSSTDDTRYHGGTESDEVAALLSLALGCRLKAGNPTRVFQRGGDPRGRPWSFQSSGRADPIPPALSMHGVVIPELLGERNVQAARTFLDHFTQLQPADSVALVRAARLYQEGIWIAEADAALSWLLLVSAIEVAANHWQKELLPAREKLKLSKPKLDALLVEAGGEELADTVAEMIVASLGATKKFVDFVGAFWPEPPSTRSENEKARLNWTFPKEIKKALSDIYGYRSEALHAGTPFPAPMCMAPRHWGDKHAECLPFGAAGAHGGIWRKEAIPMFLHTFEYIVRSGLQKWWIDMSGPS